MKYIIEAGGGTRAATLMGAALALFLPLAACDNSPTAPTNDGICWRVTSGADGKIGFQPISNDARNLETCGAHLEAVAMREHKTELAGAYQGVFVFITPEMIQTSTHLDGARFRLFDQETRGKIDHDLKWMLEDEKHPSKFAPPEPQGPAK